MRRFWKSAIMRERPNLSLYEFEVEPYDTIVIGTPVWASSFLPPSRTFMYENEKHSGKENCCIYMFKWRW